MKLLTFILILFGIVAVSPAQNTVKQRRANDCQVDGLYTFEFFAKPSFLGYQEAPAEIISIENPIFEEGNFNRLELRNTSGKTISGIKIKWFIYQLDKEKYKTYRTIIVRDDPGLVIEQETAEIETGEFAAGERKHIDFSLGRSCGEIYGALVENDRPNGLWFIEHIVSEIKYADGTKWTQQGQIKRSLKTSRLQRSRNVSQIPA